ncbi:TMhelix containing protein [Vibrio phage 2.117.O._10N.261.45.E9]|nr:TMhelix containing protein [Vibrio phage 1.117.O._10N.261.45.E9]AUR95450.1 TMhelix containing protein [Vibrio phage 1.207.B._10N.222.51.C2]AUS02341.1 TMhelix containing protein [Vibrio phage 2.117.O._10N.261.45.E9]
MVGVRVMMLALIVFGAIVLGVQLTAYDPVKEQRAYCEGVKVWALTEGTLINPRSNGADLNRCPHVIKPH